MKIRPEEFAKVYRAELGDKIAAEIFDRAMASGPCAQPKCDKNEYGCSGAGCLLNFADKDAA